jgi:hypothetical protein
VQPVGTEHDVIAGRRGIAERDVDPFSVIVEGRNANAEAVIDIRADRVVEDAGEVAPEDFHFATEHLGG